MFYLSSDNDNEDNDAEAGPSSAPDDFRYRSAADEGDCEKSKFFIDSCRLPSFLLKMCPRTVHLQYRPY